MSKSKWVLDDLHSELGFKIKHLMISNVTGFFKSFNVEVESGDETFKDAQIRLTGKMDSISTNNEQRDAHLRNSDFFEVEKFPELLFESSRFEKADDENFTLTGNLTLKGITKEVKLNVEYGGIGKDMYGNVKAGFVVTGKIKRTDFNISFNAVLETGGVALSEEVRIFSEIQLVKQAVEVAA